MTLSAEEAVARPVMQDPHLGRALADRGWVVVDDFIPTAEVDALRELLATLVPPDDHHGLLFSNQVPIDARVAAEQAISRAIGPRLLAQLQDYRLAASLFVLKLGGDSSRRIWHADPALVDERHFTSVSAWCPLVDVDVANGAFTVVEGSHRIVPVVRGGVRIQGLLFPSEPEVEALCDGPRTAITMRVGQALLYDHRLAHGSPANTSDRPRWAVNVPAVPREAPLIHYIREADGTVDVYELPDDYFYRHDAAVAVAEDPATRRVARVDAATGDWV